MIKFNYLLRTKVPYIKLLKSHLHQVAIFEGKTIKRLNFIFCGDDYLLQINRSHLNHDYYTDIITFDLSDSEQLEGEIYISAERVRENAGHFQSSFNRELMRVMLHGVLHLAGYKDKTKSEIKLMRSKEDHYLLLFEKTINEAL